VIYYSSYQASVAVPAHGRVLSGQTVNDSAHKGRRTLISRNRVIFDHDVVASPVQSTSTAVRRRFGRLAAKWQSETMHLSSPQDIYLNANHVQIIGMGMVVVPLILTSMQKQPYDWFFALRGITGQNPVPEGAAGDVSRMSALWLAWGKRNGFV
jgi:hypothetical protein